MNFGSISELTTAINSQLDTFFERESRYLADVGSELLPVCEAMGHFLLDSGKRLRPLFAAIGHSGVGGEITPQSLQALASLELVHVCALIHDDVMDESDTRRGAPSIHKKFEAIHESEGLHGRASQFGISAAILMGDLALIWAAKMLHESQLPAHQILQSLPIYDEMRVELMAGQYLDVYEQAVASESIERSLKVARFKSGKYSIERPLHFGATLAPKYSLDQLRMYSNYGLPLGEAFQLRDDVIGVFGDPAKTGKPAGDDLREGKRTVIIAMTLEKIDEASRKKFQSLFGNKELDSDGIDSLREIIKASGALDRVELLIEEMTFSAHKALKADGIGSHAKNLLAEMAEAATQRSA